MTLKEVELKEKDCKQENMRRQPMNWQEECPELIRHTWIRICGAVGRGGPSIQLQ